MNLSQKQLVVNEMKSIGFDAGIKNGQVIVGLYRQFVGLSEIRQALAQQFGEIEFRLSRIDSQKVRVM